MWIDSDSGSYEESIVRRLFLSVIVRAVEDAAGRDLMEESDEDRHEMVKSAREWLVTDSEDLKAVCEMAGVEYREVLERYRRLYAGKLR